MPEHDPFERDLTGALHRTGDSFTPDGTDLVAGGVRRGRTRRLRQRLAVIGGSVAGVAAIGVGGVLLGPPGDTSREAGAGTTLSTAKPTGLAVERQDLTGVLENLLPKGTFTPKTSQGDGIDVTGVFDDGNGAAALSVSLGRTPVNGVGCPDPALRPYDHCSTESLADGSEVTVFQGYERPDRLQETKLWYANLATPDGRYVSVMEWNAPAKKGEPVTRADPPLSPAQLTKLVSAAELRAFI